MSGRNGGLNGLVGAILAQALLRSSGDQPCDNLNCVNPRCHELRKLLENGVSKAQEEPASELLGNRDPATLEADLVILKQAQAIFERETDLTKKRAEKKGFPRGLSALARDIHEEQCQGLEILAKMAAMLELRHVLNAPAEVTIEVFSV